MDSLDGGLTPVAAAPDCAVCIANYNGRALLADCIDSILAQESAATVEIIVHDDASTDDSVVFLREHYPQVRVIVSETNVGFCVGNNRMAAATRASYLLLLNNDAALMPGALASLLTKARSTSDELVLTLPQYDWQSEALVDRGCMLDPSYNPIPNTAVGEREVAMTIGACLWIKRTFWNRLGGFPAWMESIGEDLYLCCAARLHGAHVIALNESGYRHWQGKTFGGNRVHENVLSSTVRRRRLSERNKTFTLVTCTPGIAVWPLLAVHLFALLVEGGVLAFVRRDSSVFRDIYLNVPIELRRNRKMLMSVRASNLALRHLGLIRYLQPFRPIPRKLIMLFRYGWPKLTR
ncbi:glycosyltransferase [Luteibacter sp. 9133]|uniref:glycosyltransferase family 2 protein n=1 Tax=Luteibacter sp. 9133 TaxID=1500891 RepID=UPI00068F18E1|nr:glycosyltransferase [Luteibacter sp. 9133]